MGHETRLEETDMTKSEELLQQVKDHVAKEGKILIVNGAIGDMDGCTGVLEEVINNEDSVYCKWFGCSYLFKGYPDRQIVEGLGLAKAMISAIPRELIEKNLWTKIALAMTFLFQRHKFIHMCHVWFSTIYTNEVAKVGMDTNKYGRSVKELRRAVYAVLNTNQDLLHGDFQAMNKDEVKELIAKVAEFFCLFIELDSAYRFRLQDVLAELNKEAARANIVKEVRRLFDLWISREDDLHGIRYKIIPAANLLVMFLRLSKSARDWAKKFLLELDTEKIRLDEADWYFCLKRNNYHFEGVPLENRLEFKKWIDGVRGHVMLKIENTPQGLTLNAE